jgi:tetratricopeptide (TPR) repeat protein
MSMLLRPSCLLIIFSMTIANARLRAQPESSDHQTLREMEHQDPQWETIRAHLPDPTAATPDRLELAADVLRARRFPEDALDYYNYALQRGGNESQLLNKIGVTHLELRRTEVARIYFQRVVHLKQKSAEGWNNLGAVEYLDAHFGSAVSDYKRAIKVDGKSATFHSNLGTAYFEQKDYKNARRQFDIALRIDPKMSQHDGAAGITAHLLSPEDHAHYCFEMARLYAERGDEANLMHYLTLASEGGFDVLSEMRSDKVLAGYRKDPRVLLLVQNARALRNDRVSVAEAKGDLPPLSASANR